MNAKRPVLPYKTAMNQAVKFLLIAVCCVLTLSAIGFAWTYFSLTNYLRSDEFRSMISQVCSDKMGVDGEFLPFSWTGTSVYSQGFYGEGLPGKLLKSIRADDIRAGIHPRQFWSREIGVDRIVIERVEAQAGLPSQVSPAPPLSPAHGVDKKTMFSLKTIEIHDLSLAWQPTEEACPIEISHTSASILMEEGSWQIKGSKGTLSYNARQKYEIESISGRLTGNRLHFTEALLRHPNGGTIAMSGEIQMDARPLVDLFFHPRDVPVDSFVPEDWRASLSGALHGKIHFVDDPSLDPSQRTEGTIEIRKGRLEALPVLNRIAALTQTKEFRSFDLHAAKGHFKRIGQRIEVSDLDIESRNLLRIVGAIVNDNGQLDGLLDVATVDRALAFIPGARSKVFTRRDDPYLWASPPVRVYGSAEDPQEDLTPRLKNAAVEAVADGVGKAVEKAVDAAKPLLDLLLGP